MNMHISKKQNSWRIPLKSSFCSLRKKKGNCITGNQKDKGKKKLREGDEF